jgi:hypothetical protein
MDSEIQIAHGRKTAIETRPAASDEIGWALYFDADKNSNLPPRYEIVSQANMAALADDPGAVFGADPETIYGQLRQRHPAPHREGEYLCRFQGKIEECEGEEDTRRRRRYRTWKLRRFDGWFVLDRMVTACESLGTLMDMTQQFGPVLVTRKTFENLGEAEGLRSAGFTAVSRRFDLWQLNYSPKRTRLYGYREALKTFKSRQRRFPQESLDAIYDLLRPQYNRCDDPWGVVLSAAEQSRVSPGLIVCLVRLNRCLYKEPWWRTTNNRYYPTCGRRWRRQQPPRTSQTFKDAVEACLPVLHAEEQRISPANRNKNDRWAFCRFLRQEAKALGLRIPPKPKEPKKPKKRRSSRRR